VLRRYYFLLNLFGALLWIIGFSMAASGIYPTAFVGVYAGPVLLILGSVGWIQRYRSKHGVLPDPVRSYRQVLARHRGILRYHLAWFEFMFSKLFVVWVVSIHMWVVLTYAATRVVRCSDAYAFAVQHVERDRALQESIGSIRYYGFLAGGCLSSGGRNEVTFTVVGERGTREAHIEMRKKNSSTKVVSAVYR